MQRPGTTAPHRELFRAVSIEETVAIACTCGRGADHWYAEPIKPAGQRAAEQGASEADPPSDEARSATVRSPRR